MSYLPPHNRTASFLLAVVAPCFNEEAVLRETHRRLVATLEAVPKLDFELAYIDDGSRDATLNVLRELQCADARVRVLALSRNFGHQMVVTAGLQYAAGDVVLLINADLQDPPEVIPPRLDRWRTGADVAYGVRSQRTGETRFKRWTAHAFYRRLARLTDPGGEVLRVVRFRRPLRAPALRVAGTLVIERVLSGRGVLSGPAPFVGVGQSGCREDDPQCVS